MRALRHLRPRAHGASGLDLGEMGPKAAVLFHVHQGMVTRLVIYFDRDLAFADLGLEG